MTTTQFTVGSSIVNSTKTKGYMILDIVDVNTKSYGGEKVQYFYVRYLGKQKTAFIKASSVSKWTNY